MSEIGFLKKRSKMLELMETRMTKLWIAAIPFLLVSILFAEAMKGGSEAKKGTEVVMTGDYKWLKGEKVRFEEKLKGVFTSNSKGEWDVSFHFKFKKKEYNYVGKAKGTLKDGPLEGEVRNDGGKGKRSFTFTGNMLDGKISGTHNETTKGRVKKTGIFSLSKG